MTTLIREVYRTSRLLDFASTRELTAQIGHPAHKWPEVALKELVDNSLDAAEEAGVLPVINVRLDGAVLEVADEGPGIPDDVVTDILDFTVRVSSREAYVGPTRGAQGNALKTIVAMPFALDGNAGLVEVETRGILHQLRFAVDPIAQEPVVRHERLPSARAAGTAVRVHWPEGQIELDRAGLSNMLVSYALLNPHLRLTADISAQGKHDHCPTCTDWRRWRPSDPEPALWYDLERFERRIAAAIQHDRTRGQRARTVHAFVATFQGLSATGKRKELLDRLGLQRASLEEAFVLPSGELDHGRIAGLLAAMQTYSAPVRPRQLGELGKTQLAAAIGGEMVNYRRIEFDDPCRPILAEAALFYFANDPGLVTTVGINNSPALADVEAVPGLTWVLNENRVEPRDPLWFFLHVTGPGFNYADRGKSKLVLPAEAGRQLREEIAAALEPWRKYKRQKDRDQKAFLKIGAPRPERPPTLAEAAAEVMLEAYLKASDGGALKVQPRQIMYAARDHIQKRTGRPLDSRYFCQTLLPDFIAANPEMTKDWDIIWDARGTLVEPHTGERVPLGTEEVRRYIADMGSAFSRAEGRGRWWTCGPRDRFGAVLFVEKEGFEPLFEQVKLAERLDIALMSTKGLSNTAARKLVDHLVGELGVPVFVIRDFDVSGFNIAGTLGRNTRRYQWTSAGAIDLGLRLDDVEEEGLASEKVFYETRDKGAEKKRLLNPGNPLDREKIHQKIDAQLRENGATEEETEFLVENRVELNAFTSRGLVDWIERKLAAAGVCKVVPASETLHAAALGFAREAAVARLVAKNDDLISRAAGEVVTTLDLETGMRRLLENDCSLSWDAAVRQLVNGETGL